MIAPSDQKWPPRWKTIQQRFFWVCIAIVPNAFTSYLAHALVLAAHVCVSTSATHL
jgi:hypothetical protein